MPLLPIALQLAGAFLPELLGKLGGKNAEAVAGKVVEIAQTVTGAPTPGAAFEVMKADAGLALKFREAIGAQEVELERIAAGNAAEVNATMRSEADAEHWPTYSWRPAIGFAVAINVVGCSLTVLVAYIVAMVTGKAEHLAHLPGMLAAMAGLIGVVSPILGIASWFRGKMQADPNVPTVNRG